MSAPDTNLEKQAKNHRSPLMGMAGAVIFAGILLVVFIGWLAYNGDEPDGAEVQIDGRTGQAVDADTGEAVTTQ